jgi:hypothetical protein
MSLLRERGFRGFWLAQSVSLLGDQVAVIALPLVAVLVLAMLLPPSSSRAWAS